MGAFPMELAQPLFATLLSGNRIDLVRKKKEGRERFIRNGLSVY